jgi:glycosyltransferase involved in cell wall biosynthesis
MHDVSVVIPVFNSAKYIRQAIESALAQTGVTFEILVADNASTDNTMDIVSEYAGHPLVRIFQNGKNLGMFGNLNRLVHEATSPLIKILCADDWLLPGCLAAQVGFMRARPQLAFSRCVHEGGWEGYYMKPGAKPVRELPIEINPPAGTLAFATFGCICGNLTDVIMRREAVLRHGGFDPELPFAGDYDMWSRIAEHEPFGLQNEELVHLRDHEEQASVTLNRKNELVAQTNMILSRLYSKASPEDRPLLRLHFALRNVAAQWHRGVKCLLAGQPAGFLATWVRREYTYANPITLFLWLASANGRIGAGQTTRRLAARIHEINRSK